MFAYSQVHVTIGHCFDKIMQIALSTNTYVHVTMNAIFIWIIYSSKRVSMNIAFAQAPDNFVSSSTEKTLENSTQFSIFAFVCGISRIFRVLPFSDHPHF